MALAATAGLVSMIGSAGALEVYESEAELRAAAPGWTARRDQGIGFETVRGEALAELQPGLSPRFVVGVHVPGYRNVSDPLDFTRAVGEAALARGATLRRAEIRAIEPGKGLVTLRLADGGAVTARQAVIAGGAWSKALTAPLGDPVPLETERGYNTTLPPGSFDLRRQINFSGHGFVVSSLTSGIRVGGAVELAGLVRPPNFARADAMLAKAKAFLPELRTEGGRQWDGVPPVAAGQPAGHRPCTGEPAGRLCLRAWPSRADAGGRHGAAGHRPRHRPTARHRPHALLAAAILSPHVPTHLPLHRWPHLRQPGSAGGRRRAGAARRRHDRKARRFPRPSRLDPARPDVRAARPRRHERLDPLPAARSGQRRRDPLHRNLGVPRHVRPWHHRHG